MRKPFYLSLMYIFLLALLLIILFPLVYIFLSSFKEAKEIMLGGVNIWPSHFTLENYINAWNAADFATYTWNSVIYAVTVTIATIFISTMLGFCITRQDFIGKKFVSSCYYGSMFIAGAVTIYPIFMMLVEMHLNKTLLGLIIATIGMGQSFAVLMITNYLKSIPRDLDESAIIDGCSPFRLYRSIIFPVIIPAVSVVAMVTFQNTWNNYMLPLALTTATPKLRPLAVGVTALSYAADGKTAGQWDLLIAGSCMAMLPILLVYIFANRFFISEIMSGSVKG